MRALALGLGALALAACTTPQPPRVMTVAVKQCPLSADDHAANRLLDYASFDQSGTRPSTARKLSDAGCFEQAIAAGSDYLIHGPWLTDPQRNNVRWHLAQHLGMAGRDAEAALMMSGSRRGVDPNRPTFDWDAYVIGSYASLVKDRATLDAMSERLAASGQRGNQLNGLVLRRFQKSFGEPYRVAYGEDRCAVPIPASLKPN